MIAYHSSDIQIFDTDDLVFSHQYRRLFLQEIVTLIRDLLVNSRHFDPLFVPVVRSRLLARQSSLLDRKSVV